MWGSSSKLWGRLAACRDEKTSIFELWECTCEIELKKPERQPGASQDSQFRQQIISCDQQATCDRASTCASQALCSLLKVVQTGRCFLDGHSTSGYRYRHQTQRQVHPQHRSRLRLEAQRSKQYQASLVLIRPFHSIPAVLGMAPYLWHSASGVLTSAATAEAAVRAQPEVPLSLLCILAVRWVSPKIPRWPQQCRSWPEKGFLLEICRQVLLMTFCLVQTQLQAYQHELALSEATGRDLVTQLSGMKESFLQVLELVSYHHGHLPHVQCSHTPWLLQSLLRLLA